RGDPNLRFGVERGSLLSLGRSRSGRDQEQRHESTPSHGPPSLWFSSRRRPTLRRLRSARSSELQVISTLNRSDEDKRLPRRSHRLLMRVAFVGKGGVGKSVIAATVTRLLARRGQPVLALDIDTMPGLVVSLGGISGTGTLPEDLAERR